MELSKLEKELLNNDNLYKLVTYLKGAGISLKEIKKATRLLESGIDISVFSCRSSNSAFTNKQIKLITLCKKKGGCIKTFAENVEKQGWISSKQEQVMLDATVIKYPSFGDNRLVYREKTAQELKDEIEQEMVDAQMLAAMGHDYDPNGFSVN